MNTEKEKSAREETPMTRVWAIVVGSMLVVGTISLIWYSATIAKEKRDNNKEEEVIQQSIEKITAYRDLLKSGTTSSQLHIN